MKNLAVIFTIIFFSNSSIGQTTNQDTGKVNCRFSSGILTEKGLDSGTYVYATSIHHSYIEFVLPFFGRSNAKYRVEKLLNDEIFIVTKIYLTNNKSVSTCFLAIDSTMLDKIKMKKKGLKQLRKSRIYEDMRADDSIILYFISLYISKHGLQNNFLNFNPRLYVAWLKVKS